ncbi:hypothetical protein CR513_08109, partial [Mucuna pruriens]
MLTLVVFTYNNSYHSSIGMVPYKALYGKRCRNPLCWFELGGSFMVGPETIEMVKIIQENMRVAQSKDLKFKQRDDMFLKVTSWIRVDRALNSSKFSLRFVGPYQIIKRVGEVSYQIALPLTLANLHNICKYLHDLSHMIELDDVQLRDTLSYEAVPLRIEDWRIKQLRGKENPLIKAVLGGTFDDNSMWELENQKRISYLDMFTPSQAELTRVNKRSLSRDEVILASPTPSRQEQSRLGNPRLAAQQPSREAQ